MCQQLDVLCASHALVQATVGVGTVIIVYIGVAYTGGGGVRSPSPFTLQTGNPHRQPQKASMSSSSRCGTRLARGSIWCLSIRMKATEWCLSCAHEEKGFVLSCFEGWGWLMSATCYPWYLPRDNTGLCKHGHVSALLPPEPEPGPYYNEGEGVLLTANVMRRISGF